MVKFHKIVTAHRVRFDFESPITHRAAARMPSLDELEDGDCGGAETPYENHSVIMEVRWVNSKSELTCPVSQSMSRMSALLTISLFVHDDTTSFLL